MNPEGLPKPFVELCEGLYLTKNGQTLGGFMGVCMDGWSAMGGRGDPRAFAKAKAENRGARKGASPGAEFLTGETVSKTGLVYRGTMPEKELEPIRHDETLERIVLGAIIAGHKQADEAMSILEKEDFFRPADANPSDHQKIFTIMQSLRDKGESADLVSVYDAIGRMGDLQGAGLLQSLTNLGQESHLTPEIMYAVRELRRLSMSRESLRLLDNVKVLLQERGGQTEQIIEGAIDKLSEIARETDELDEQGITYFDAAAQALAKLGNDTGPKIYTDVKRLDDLAGATDQGASLPRRVHIPFLFWRNVGETPAAPRTRCGR